MGATAILFWAFPPGWRRWFLVVVTVAFLLLYSPLSLFLLVLSTLIVWWPLHQAARPSGYQVAIPACLLLVCFLLLRWLDQSARPEFLDFALPLGLAYYTLRCLHYLLERYKGNLPAHGFADIVAYLFFLPTLVVGPIHRFEPFIRDWRRHRWNEIMASEGLERIVVGYAKVVVLSNFLLSEVASSWLGRVNHDWSQAYLEVIRYAVNLYVQFSGYSDIAIGFSLILGFRVMENFNWPFLKANISDFWGSWHISLTSFVRDNIYMVTVARTRSAALASIAAMIAIGIWHELSWRYLLWGLYHGLGIACWQVWRRRIRGLLPPVSGALATIWHCAAVLLTFHFVALGFMLVAGPDTQQAWSLIATLFFLG
jgi:alginate O-acetyltransferase complex protein AlgI